jgi:hypothetical protein
MKYSLILFLAIAICLINQPVFSQTEGQTEIDAPLLGLPGDNLDLYGVLSLFQKSKTIEDFEKALNEEKTGLNNLDLNLDNKVDFIKVTTKQKDDDFSFILQVDIAEKEVQDVAVILLDKDQDGKMTLQIVGDEELYGKNYVIEPKTTPTPSVTANPAYTGDAPVTVNVPASTTVVVVETIPVVKYVYSPVYVPYYPPYYYGYYPPYYAAFTVMAVGIYRHNNYYYHSGYHGGHYGGGNVYIHNEINFNNYNNSRNRSTTVANNKANGNYSGKRASTRQSGTSASNRTTATPSTRQSGGTSSNRAAVTPSSRQSGGTSTLNRATTTSSTRQSGGTSATNRSASSSMGASRSMSSGGYSGGGNVNRSNAGMSRSGSGSGGRRR